MTDFSGEKRVEGNGRGESESESESQRWLGLVFLPCERGENGRGRYSGWEKIFIVFGLSIRTVVVDGIMNSEQVDSEIRGWGAGEREDLIDRWLWNSER